MKNSLTRIQSILAEQELESPEVKLTNQTAQIKSDLLNKHLKSAEEIAAYYKIPLEAAKRIISEPEFLLNVKTVEKNALRLRFYLSGCNRLMSIAETDKPRTAIMAMKLLATILGEAERKPLVQIQNNQQNENYYEAWLRKAHERRRQEAERGIDEDSEVDEP